MQLRPYQTTALQQIEQAFLMHRKILLVMPTGSGKTAIFLEIMKKTRRALMVVRGKHLVEQTATRLAESDADFGIYQAENTQNIDAPLLLCSIDTLYNRKVAPETDLVIIDEAHLANGEGYRWFLAQYPTTKILSVTATPYSSHGLRHLVDAIIEPVSVSQLIDEKYLVKPVYFGPAEPDMSQFKYKGDYQDEDALKAMRPLTQNIVDAYVKYSAARFCLVFAINKEHAHELKDALPSGFGYIDAETKNRSHIIANAKRGIININVLTTGVDIPRVQTILIARPTKSLTWHLQALGRGTRPYPGKTEFGVIDLAGNCSRLGFIETRYKPRLSPVSSTKGIAPTKTCKKCYAIISLSIKICPCCGFNFPPISREKRIEQVRYEISEMTDKKIRFLTILNRAILGGYKPGWMLYQLDKKYSLADCEKWPIYRRLKQEYDEFLQEHPGYEPPGNWFRKKRAQR